MSHILLVEDDIGIAENVLLFLDAQNYNTTHLTTGEFVVDAVQKGQPDLILLDLMLPVKSGTECCKEIRNFSDVPIIMLTAKGEEIDRVIGFELGADDYVTKPFSIRELILRIKAVLKRKIDKKDLVEVERQFGDLRMDIESHEVFVNNEEVFLTALEFKLLKQLVDRRGRVQSRDQLLADGWGYSSDVTTRTVDTHIKRLREKLGVIGKYVQTIRGVGYKFSRTPD